MNIPRIEPTTQTFPLPLLKKKNAKQIHFNLNSTSNKPAALNLTPHNLHIFLRVPFSQYLSENHNFSRTWTFLNPVVKTLSISTGKTFTNHSSKQGFRPHSKNPNSQTARFFPTHPSAVLFYSPGKLLLAQWLLLFLVGLLLCSCCVCVTLCLISCRFLVQGLSVLLPVGVCHFLRGRVWEKVLR